MRNTMPRRPCSSIEYRRTLVSAKVPSHGTAGPRPTPAPTIRNGISPTQLDPSYTSGRVCGGSSGATAASGTRQCRKVRSRHDWLMI